MGVRGLFQSNSSQKLGASIRCRPSQIAWIWGIWPGIQVGKLYFRVHQKTFKLKNGRCELEIQLEIQLFQVEFQTRSELSSNLEWDMYEVWYPSSLWESHNKHAINYWPSLNFFATILWETSLRKKVLELLDYETHTLKRWSRFILMLNYRGLRHLTQG